MVSDCARNEAELILITGRNEEKLHRIEEKLKGNCDIISHLCDMSTVQDIDKLISFFEEKTHGRLDVLIGIHGTAGESNNAVSELDLSDFAKVMDVNFISMVRLTNGIAKIMSRNSSIVFVSSINSHSPVKSNSAYCCSKAALAMFMKCAALDLGRRQIRVNCVAPGLMDTEFGNFHFESTQDRKDKLIQIGKQMPFGRINTVQGVSNAILFLASDESMDITGTEQIVDCGASLKKGSI